jgi:hypothetical protein
MKRFVIFGFCLLVVLTRPAAAQVTADAVRRAVDRGRDFLLRQQQGDGSWPEGSHPRGGVSSLVMLALLESGVKPNHPAIDQGLKYLRTIRPAGSKLQPGANTYVVSLQTMVFCLARPQEDLGRIKENVAWLEEAQIKSGEAAGMWDYGISKLRGDNSCTQFALLGLREAAELEPRELRVKVDPDVWRRVREHFGGTQGDDGGWGYQGPGGPSGSMTSAGISSLIIAGMRMHEGEETIRNGVIEKCGEWKHNDAITRGLAWLGRHDRLVETNPGAGQWHFYYLYGLERAARLSGQRFIGQHDWYREGAKMLVESQGAGGVWERGGLDGSEILSTSFALLFLSKGRSPVLMNKLRHDSADASRPEDWNNDRNDVRNLVEHCSRHWERRMTWQVVDAKVQGDHAVLKRVEDFLQAPVVFMTGHEAPKLSELERKVLRGYVDQGGFILAEACCGRKEFDAGVRQLFKEMFPDQPLRVLPSDHAVWKADYSLQADDSLEGIDLGCRTSVIYSREDLSCYWQQKDNPELGVQDQATALRATRIGTNVLAYATGKELLPDKLDARKIVALEGSAGNRWVLQIGKLKHGGDYNVAPMAVTNLMASLRDNLKMNVAAEQRELTPLDENLVRFPFLYMHGRSQFSFNEEQITRLREHLQRGGTLFADACCGREPFDTAFRALAKRLFPESELKQIPVTHELFGNTPGGSDPIGYDLSRVQYTKTMPRTEGEPFLEGIELDGRLVVIYSKYDIGCALERHQGSDCRGYTHESAVKIATNVILYALLQ